MIDTDKMRAAFVATPLCQHAWTKKDDDDDKKPTMLCAVSAMVSFAGVQPDLIHKMATSDSWFKKFARPVLKAEYGIPKSVAKAIPGIFDHAPDEARAVAAVLAICERHNMDELHGYAIAEDAMRYPQHTCAEPPMTLSQHFIDFPAGAITFTVTGYEYNTGWTISAD